MLPAGTFYATLGGSFALVLAAFVAMTKLLGDRITDLREDT